MIIHTLWGARHGEATPELMDEYSLEDNREGFDRECEQAPARATSMSMYRFSWRSFP